jgi:SAM-dependent methyltransferase
MSEALKRKLADAPAAELRYRTTLAFYRLWQAAGGPAYMDEIKFWEGIARTGAALVFDPKVRAMAVPAELRRCVVELATEFHGLPRLLEVGSGPLSLLAGAVDEGLCTVVAVDPLARVYRQLLDRHGIAYPIRPRVGLGESLTQAFPQASFDLVYSSNALDHTRSPRRCLEQMCQVLRPGGFLLLEGLVREGTAEHWKGLHQHDLLSEHGHLVHFDRAGRRTELTHGLPLICLTEHVSLFRERGIEAFGYELPAGMLPDAPWNWQFRPWYTLLFRRAA